MRVGILGSGLIGGKLGTIFARSGHEVVFSYSRDLQKLEKLAKEAAATAHAGTPAEAVQGADALLLAVHWTCVDDVLMQAGRLSGKTLITCSLPMSADDSHMVIGRTNSGAEALSAKVPRANVVSAFSTVPSEALLAVYKKRELRNLPDLVYCGDHTEAKKTANRLIRDVGFNPLDLGPLSIAANGAIFAAYCTVSLRQRRKPSIGLQFSAPFRCVTQRLCGSWTYPNTVDMHRRV